MAIQYFQPEVWSSTLLSVLRKALVFGNPLVVNRAYEGSIANGGDTVHIVSIGDPTIGTYSKDTDITIQVLTDADRTLTIDQLKYFGFEVDDVDNAQSARGGALMTEAATRGAFGLADVADQFLAAKMLGAASSNTPVGVVDASSTATNVYDLLLVPMGVALDQANVPSNGRFVVLAPDVYGKLQLDARFVRQNEAGTNALHTGVVGDAAGFTILKSNNLTQVNRTAITATTASGVKTITGAAAGTFTQADVGATITGTGIGSTNKVASVLADGTGLSTTVNQTASATVADIALSGAGRAAIAGTNIATTYAEQINKVEAFRPEKRFADALKGLHLYGAKVVRPEALVVGSVKTS